MAVQEVFSKTEIDQTQPPATTQQRAEPDNVLNTRMRTLSPSINQVIADSTETQIQNHETQSANVAPDIVTSPAPSATEDSSSKYEVSKNKSLLAGMALMIGGEIALCGTGAVSSFAQGDSAAGFVATALGICTVAVTVGLYFFEKYYHSKHAHTSDVTT